MKQRLAVAFIAIVFGMGVGIATYRVSIYLFGSYSFRVVGGLAFVSAIGLFSLYDRLGLVPLPPDDSVRLFRQGSETDRDDETKASP